MNQDYEALNETAEEWGDDQPPELLSDEDRKAIEAEIADLDEFARLATSIDHNAKGKALLKALRIAMNKAAELKAEQKAIIFTESRRTQNYLVRVLADSPWKDSIVLFNGSNTDDRSKQIYAAWLKRHQGTDRVSGSRTADMRSALVDYFRGQGQIMIATEAGAEGINLQFCSLVVLRPAVEPAAHRAAHRPLPPLRPEARCRSRELPQPEERGGSACFPTPLGEISTFRGRLRRQR